MPHVQNSSSYWNSAYVGRLLATSDWVSLLHMVRKADGSWRPCGDYCALYSHGTGNVPNPVPARRTYYRVKQYFQKSTYRKPTYRFWKIRFNTKHHHLSWPRVANAMTTHLLIYYDDLATDQATDEELQPYLIGQVKLSLNLISYALPSSTKKVYCDISTDRIRPFITKRFRQAVLQATQNISHPGTRATWKMISERFTWLKIHRDSRNFAKQCLKCQRNNRHNVTLLQRRTCMSERFAHLHINIVGPFPISEGQRYCLTVIDRFTRWPDAFMMMPVNTYWHTTKKTFVHSDLKTSD